MERTDHDASITPLDKRVAPTNDLAGVIDPNLLESAPGEPATLQSAAHDPLPPHSAALGSVQAAGWHHDFDGLGIKAHDEAGKHEISTPCSRTSTA